eukprot:NODE_369_length_1795_cov_113.582474_g271_i0.p1 GENE.NODE_369_length_1795_cov_113.582474_g271_i0~~NODE_369_length_1795_cov_113.582474_g271_i0.p1  ORF type:complete len:275 (-),score=51.21 NODE_369_length_1795_cov_113.582474_g271_i0:829-1653(-)
MSHQKAVKGVLKLLEHIKGLLTGDQVMLFDTFLEFDKSLDGRIDMHEFSTMLRSFDSDVTDKDIDKYMVEIESGHESVTAADQRQVSFMEFLDWWEVQRHDEHGRGNDLWLLTKLKIRFTTSKLKEWTIGLFVDSDLEDKLAKLSSTQLETTLANYKEEHFLLRLWCNDVLSREQRQQELELMEKAKSVVWDADERAELQDLFRRVNKGKDTMGLESGLPRASALLNCDLTYSTLERTMKLYPSRLDFPTFLLWWACRAESGKLSVPWNAVPRR